MKFKLITTALIFCSLQAFSQSKNNISVVYGFSSTIVDIHNVIGDFGYENKTAFTAGFLYTKQINKILSVQAGLFFADDKTEETSDLPGLAGIKFDGDLKIVSLPIIAKFTFFKYLYADAGISFDDEINHSGNYSSLDESGIGIEMGIGGQYAFNRLALFINPYVKVYGTTHFNSKEDFNLLEGGYKFGLGYNF
jgi:hypothetical protein